MSNTRTSLCSQQRRKANVSGVLNPTRKWGKVILGRKQRWSPGGFVDSRVSISSKSNGQDYVEKT